MDESSPSALEHLMVDRKQRSLLIYMTRVSTFSLIWKRVNHKKERTSIDFLNPNLYSKDDFRSGGQNVSRQQQSFTWFNPFND